MVGSYFRYRQFSGSRTAQMERLRNADLESRHTDAVISRRCYWDCRRVHWSTRGSAWASSWGRRMHTAINEMIWRGTGVERGYEVLCRPRESGRWESIGGVLEKKERGACGVGVGQMGVQSSVVGTVSAGAVSGGRVSSLLRWVCALVWVLRCGRGFGKGRYHVGGSATVWELSSGQDNLGQAG